MRLTAHQIGFLPWPGLFAKVADADLFVVFDDVQYERRGWDNRNRIKTRDGEWTLSVPVKSRDHFNTKLKDAEIVPGPWQRKHIRTIELAYKASPHYQDILPVLGMLETPPTLLLDLNLLFFRWALLHLGITTPIVRASDYGFKGEKSALVLDMCKQLGATEYVFGALGREYADAAAFRYAGITPLFQAYEPCPYRQLHGAFMPGLSIIDLMANCGPTSRYTTMAGHYVPTA